MMLQWPKLVLFISGCWTCQLHVLLLVRCVAAFCPFESALSSVTPPSVQRQTQQQQLRQTTLSSTALSSTFNDNSSSIKRSRNKNPQDITLYDIIGASPKDTPQQLKRRYTTLVKSLHPDVNPSRRGKFDRYDLSEINAAWEVLGDKKQRQKYDRELQAKEFTEGVEALVGLGIQTAIPFLKKTADTTVKAVDVSTKVAQESAEQAKFAYGVFELDQKSRTLEQKAAAEIAKAQRLQKEMEGLPNKRIASLEQPAKALKNVSASQSASFSPSITSTEANRILKNFQVTRPPGPLASDIKSLYETEIEFKESTKSRQTVERAAQVAQRKLDQAQSQEVQAQKRLEEAQKALLQAQQNHADAQAMQLQAVVEETKARQAVQKVEKVLQTKSEKVRLGVWQQQESYIDGRAKELKAEQSEMDASAKELQKEADAIRNQARQLEK